MRIQRLDLIRYGKFTDKQVDLPRAPRDFHFVVGLNEAGKSTLRDAIQALFWGIPPRSPLDFVHPKNELRVGAKIEHDGQTVEFQRAKGNRQTLRDTRDAVLPDNALAAFLGTTDASFFEKMFSLDHTRLEAGGQSILDSDDDASQVLFQASAGIASLGKVRDELARQADALWAPRKSGDRAYYQAADQLERATALLKSVVVRTKDWAEAHDKVEALTASAAGERDRHEGTSKQRSVLERVRRVAPGLRELRNVEAALAALEEVVDLPVGAMAAVDSADQDLARAQEVRNLRSTEVDRLDTSLKDLHLDVAILPLGADIEDLNAKRLTYSNYPRDLEKRTTEVNMAWETVQAAMAQLRWNEPDENAVRQRMPPLDKRKSLDELVKSNGRIEEAARSTRQNADAKKLDVESLTKQLAELPETAIPVALTKAQNRALKLGDIEATHLRIARDLTNAQANTATAFQRLDVWTRPSADLRAMLLPDKAYVDGRIREKQELLAELKQAETRLKEQAIKVAKARLAVKQYQDAHQPVTREDVVAARKARDAAWDQVKIGTVTPATGAAAVDAGIQRADEFADARLGKVEQETEFQNRRHKREDAELEHEQLITSTTQVNEKLSALTNEWVTRANIAKLPDMSLEKVVAWMALREMALSAEDAEDKLKTDLAQFKEQTNAIAGELSAALAAAGATVANGAELTTLVLEAQAFTNAAEAARGKRDTLKSQLTSSRTNQISLEQRAREAQDDLEKWKTNWVAALKGLGLEETAGLTEGESALELIVQIEVQIEAMRDKRVNRIEAMKTDLKTFEQEFERVARQVDQEFLKQGGDTATIALVRRLTVAREIQKEHVRLSNELLAAQNALKNADEAMLSAKARIEPLHARAGTQSVEALRETIGKSDRRRQLTADAERLNKHLLEHGDGFKRDALEKELDVADLAQIPVELAGLEQRMTASLAVQRQLAADLATAQSVLEKIAGSDVAAKAEAERQSALAAMAEATERYIQVGAASHLLRWAIDQYREKKQGPLLVRAGTIFSEITEKAFQKFHVDYEQTPPALEGVRANGALVGVSGLSSGTRDQLYLALRLAALELHLERAHVMPFIADDLFINFDDNRSEAGLQVLAKLSEQTQVIFLSHHGHLIDRVRNVFGEHVNTVNL